MSNAKISNFVVNTHYQSGKMKKLFAVSALCAVLSVIATSCRRANEWRISEGAIWHTTYRMVYNSPVTLDDSVTEILTLVEQSLSPFAPTSLISRINRNETDTIDTLIRRVFDISQLVSAKSHGRFDPTVSPLVNLWGFGTDSDARFRAESDSGDFTVEQSLIDSALLLTGISDCSIRNNLIIKKHQATSFNFSAVTKGYACDLVAEMFRRNNVYDFMIEIGGEVATGGHNPENELWRIQIDAPESTAPDPHTTLKVINVTDKGIATSGNYRNFHDTRRYGRFGHTIDPVSGYPVKTDILSATVTAPTAGEADAWATACMASGADSALAMISRQPGVECLLVTLDGDSAVIISTPGFPE